MSVVLCLQIILVALGSICFISTGVGVLRFPDFYTRIHAAGIADSLGLPLMLVALMLEAGWTLLSLKLLLLMIFMLITGPTATHAITKAAFWFGLVPKGSTTIRPEQFTEEDVPQ